MSIALPDHAFTEEQKEYLSGFFEGLRQSISCSGAITAPDIAPPPAEVIEKWFGVPVDEITKEESFKRACNPWQMWNKIVEYAIRKKFPEGGDVFRMKYHGLFYVAPAQDAFMLRVRIPGNLLSATQLRGLAEIASKWGAGHADLTTRGNFQIREIKPGDTLEVLMRLQEIGLISKGAGADNVRNITATPTSGLDPQEVFDVRPLAKALQHYILNEPNLFDLPRKFNISFDSGGSVSTVADTNDIAFIAVQVQESDGVEAGVYFRVQIAGTTGHGDFARETDLLIKPEETVAVAAAMLRVFSAHGNRTNRKKARLKYLVDEWGVDRFLEETEKQMAFPLRRTKGAVPQENHPVVRHGHVGVFRQKQRGLNYIGLVLPMGRLTSRQMEKLASISEGFGNGELRTTVWQNLLLPNVPDAKVEAAKRAIRGAGLHYQATSFTAGLIACTGNTGCKYAATDTKKHGSKIGEYLNKRLSIDAPLNIHLTGCPHSCAQHHISDIGLLGAQVQTTNGETVEGYHVYVGGSSDQFQQIGRAVYHGVPFSELPPLIEKMVRVYLRARRSGEGFAAFCARHDVKELQELFDAESHRAA